MKKGLPILYSAFIFCLGSAIAVSFLDGYHSMAGIFIVSSFIVSVVIMYSWMRYVKKLIVASNKLLNKDDYKARTLAFANLERLQQNQLQVAQKFDNAASLISNLTHPERLKSAQVIDVNDPIGKALMNIKAEMQRVKAEEEKRSWITNGLAHFGEVLRNKAEVKEYGYAIISNLVKYMNASQGGLYIEYEDEESAHYLELTACYAYGKRKHTEHRIEEGQGVLGQCMLEKEFILMADLPEDFVKITSGLGEATPRQVVVAPLIFNDIFCGAIEMASFELWQPHHIEFIKKVCENIASEIAALKNIRNTQSLLHESNTLTQELQSREEEMQQNLEELAATQEEMARKQIELSGIINAIDSTLATAEFDAAGKLIKHNAILEKFTGYSAESLRAKNYALILGTSNDVWWRKILKEEIKSGDYKTRSANGADLWLSVTFTIMSNTGNEVEKLLCMIQDITQKKLKEKEFERLSLVANNTDNSVIITDGSGTIEYVNAGFTKMTGYEFKDVVGMKPGKLLQGSLTDKQTVQKLSKHIAAGVPVNEEILNYNKRGETYWVSLAINPVKEDNGVVTKFISIQADITQTKIKSLDFHQKMEALSRSNAIIEINKKGIITEINDNYLDLLGYERDEVIGKSYSLLTHKDNVFEKLMDTIDEYGVQSGVFPRYDKSGQRHYMKLMDYPVLNLKGEFNKIIEFGVDVSNEKRLEKEAERKESELRSYLTGVNNTIASAEFSLDGKFKDANEIFLKVMGFSKEDLNDKSFEFLMGDDQTVIMMWEVLRFGKFFSGEFKMKNKAGKELWLTGTFNPITIEGEVPEKIMMFAQFTTQEKEKLSELNAMVQALKSTLPVLEFNHDFVCKTANEKALKIFGMTRLELRTKTILDFIEPNFHLMWNQHKNDIVNNEFVSFVIPFLTSTQTMGYEVSISVTRNPDGKIAKIIVLLVKEVIDKVSILKVV